MVQLCARAEEGREQREHRRELSDERAVFLAGLRVAVPGAQALQASLHGVPPVWANLRPDVQQGERLQVDALLLARITIVVCKDAAEGNAERRVTALAGDDRLPDLSDLLLGADLWQHITFETAAYSAIWAEAEAWPHAARGHRGSSG